MQYENTNHITETVCNEIFGIVTYAHAPRIFSGNPEVFSLRIGNSIPMLTLNEVFTIHCVNGTTNIRMYGM